MLLELGLRHPSRKTATWYRILTVRRRALVVNRDPLEDNQAVTPKLLSGMYGISFPHFVTVLWGHSVTSYARYKVLAGSPVLTFT